MSRFQHILIVDDDPITTQIIFNLLKTRVDHIEQTADGNEAIGKILNGHFDLVFLDLNLPGKSGIEILDEIRGMSIAPRIIGISGTKEHGKKAVFTNRGLHALLSKPLYSKEIFAAIEY